MRKILLMMGLSLSLFSTEITINGKYAAELRNPFLAKLGVRNKTVKIPTKSKAIIMANTTTNLESDNLIYNQINYKYSFDKHSCNRILKRYLSEDFNIKSNSTTTANCEIVSSDIYLEFIDDLADTTPYLSNVIIDTKIRLLIKKGNKELVNKVISNKMDKTLGITGNNYNWSIRYTFDFSYNNLNETIQKITEYSIYTMLNKNINKKGL